MKEVILQTCYHWHCEECGQAHFAMPVKAEFGPGEREEAYRAFHELEEWAPLPDGWQDFEMVQMPETVTCKACGATFATQHERTDDEE